MLSVAVTQPGRVEIVDIPMPSPGPYEALVRNRVAFSSVGATLAAIFLSCGQFGGDPTLGKVYILNSIAAVVVGGTALTGGTGGAGKYTDRRVRS